MAYVKRTVEEAIEMYNNDSTISEETKQKIAEAFRSGKDIYKEWLDDGNKEDFLKPGTFKLKDLTWEMVSQGRGKGRYYERCYGMSEVLNYSFHFEYQGHGCSSTISCEERFNKAVEHIKYWYGEDCPIEYDGHTFKNVHPKFLEHELRVSESITDAWC